jgi:hypothetical protein
VGAVVRPYTPWFLRIFATAVLLGVVWKRAGAHSLKDIAQLAYTRLRLAIRFPLPVEIIFCICCENFCELGMVHAMNFGRAILILTYS